jgi:uncharacterized protein (DUF433 family)
MARQVLKTRTAASRSGRRAPNGTATSSVAVRARRRANAAIRKTPGTCGGRARIAGTRIPIWGLEQARRLGLTDRAIIDRYPSLTHADLSAAWDYVASHGREIERDIRGNEER